MRNKIIYLLAVCVLLTGCTSTNDVPKIVQENALHNVSDSIVWDNMCINAITPVCAFETQGDVLFIFPYNNNDSHITVRKILISNNGFWDTVKNSYNESDNIRETDKYSLVTTMSAETYGYIPIDDEYAYIVTTGTLPSSYVECILQSICNLST